MNIDYIAINEANYELLRTLMTAYYRDAEDADTPLDEIDDFIHMLFELLQSGSIHGRLLYYKAAPAGFVLWNIDSEGGMFSEMPGYGTILELCVNAELRMLGIGAAAVCHAEKAMLNNGAEGLYVLAHPDAQGFWKRLGYNASGKAGRNELPICIKKAK